MDLASTDSSQKNVTRLGVPDMATDFQELLWRVSMVTAAEELNANLAELASQCDKDYVHADRLVVDDKSELLARVSHAKAVYADMRHLIDEREATQGFFRKWRASHRATRACIRFRSAQALVRMAIDDAENSNGGRTSGDQTQQPKFDECLNGLTIDILRETISFAVSVSEELDKLIETSSECQAGRSATFYPRVFALDRKKPSWTHTNQFVLAFGALSFFLYVVDWLLFQKQDEVLMGVVFDPIACSLSEAITDICNQLPERGKHFTKNGTRALIAGLHKQYAEAPALFGKDEKDQNSGIWLAAYAITEEINNKAEIFPGVILSAFVQGLVALELPKRIDALQVMHEARFLPRA